MERFQFTKSAKGLLKSAAMPVFIFSFVVNILLFASPLYMMQIYDRVLSSRSEFTLVSLSVILFFVMALSGAIEFVRSRLLSRSGAKFSVDMDDRLFKAVNEVERKSPRAGASQYFRDSDTVRDFVSGNGMLAFCDAPLAPLFIIACWIIHPWIGIMALGGGIVLFGLAIASEYSTRGAIKKAGQASVSTSVEVSTALRNSEAIHALGMTKAMQNRWIGARGDLMEHQTKANDRGSALSTFSKFFRQLLQSAVLGLGAYLAIKQEISPGLMIAASILVGRALQPVEQAVANWKGFLAARNSFGRLDDLFSNLAKPNDRPALPDPKGHLTVDKVSITPDGALMPTLREATFEVKPGDVVAIIGPSASGKSTLVRALTGLWSPSGGSLRMDGYTIDQWEPDVFGSKLGYVPQEVELFSGSVAANIARLGTFEMDDVIVAATTAGLHELIQRFPDGYNTIIGPGGLPLSGGQKQRIALARALFGNPVLLVLDEPNSNLDAAGEMSLMHAIRTAKQNGIGVIFTTHKPTLLQVADRILVLTDGAVHKYGPTNEVLPAIMRPREVSKNANELRETGNE